MPSAGPILALHEPAGPGIRVDSGIAAGGIVPVEYDPLLSKISAWAPDRAAACARLREALAATVVLGPTTNLAFLIDVLAHPAFPPGAPHRGFLAEHLPTWHAPDDELPAAALAAATALLRRTAAPGATTDTDVPTPWDTLGAWRLGR